MRPILPKLVYADSEGQIYDHPYLTMAGMSGPDAVIPETIELVPLPEGSRLFTIPDTPPIAWDTRKMKFTVLEKVPGMRGKLQAVSAFMAPGYARTLLPACDYNKKRAHLPLWSYTAVGWDEERDCFVVAATKVDNNSNWNPENYDDRLLDPLVRKYLKELPDNRLLEQLSRCAVDYHCFAAKNLFFQRWEAPLPTSPACNAACLGCISLQPSDYCPASQERIKFVPTPAELVELAVPHLQRADQPIVSYGQGCEGDPILQAPVIAEATRLMKASTSRGTVNFNSNGSLPDKVRQLCDSGMDSFRFSLNSVLEERYNAYYRPRGYSFKDVKESVKISKGAGRFTMINYLISPGVNDAPEEVQELKQFVADTGLDMIQMRNLSIDPDYYNKALRVTRRGIGIYRLLAELKREFPKLQFGYYNRCKEDFFPPGFETGWPIRG